MAEQPKEQGKTVRDVKEEKKPEVKDPNRIEYTRDQKGNLDLVLLRLVNNINSNLVSVLGVLKHLANAQEKK